MVARATDSQEPPPLVRQSTTPGRQSATPSRPRAVRGTTSPSKRQDGKEGGTGGGLPTAKSMAQDVSDLKDFQLGDCLGKGAFGSVYRALNWGTGETVAVKQIKLVDLPKSELRVIMLEIDLLKNLDHPNIVKYHGFVKSAETLNIILEYCENGSLHSISKNFGRFPENLVGLYMSQVLHGLLYLHEQGVIHRDIKGANILTTKEGLVKLADFGVASRTTGLREASVVGTPYWMAPEVIELSGATTASDIWSLGCTVIELLEGKPPYYKLQPMPALFRIVNDDHPPLPQGASPAVRDFLMQCFQKDPNLRVSARKLLKHPWIVNARRSDSVVPKKSTEYEEAVKSVQEWNEALSRSPPGPTARKTSRQMVASPIPERADAHPLAGPPKRQFAAPLNPKIFSEKFISPDGNKNNNWDDYFSSAISPSAMALPHLKPHDNFGGLISDAKLKAIASSDSSAIDDDDIPDDIDFIIKSPLQAVESDPLQTIRPAAPISKKSATPASRPKSSSGKSPRKYSIPSPRHAAQTLAQLPNITTQLKPTTYYREDTIDDYSDLIADNDSEFERKVGAMQITESDNPLSQAFSTPKAKRRSTETKTPKQRKRSQSEKQPAVKQFRTSFGDGLQKFAENEGDEDFSDILNGDNLEKAFLDDGSEQGTLLLSSKLSSNSWLGDLDDEDDPFDQLEEGFDEMDLEANIARDKNARLRGQVEGLVASLKTSQDGAILAEISDQLVSTFQGFPETKSILIGAHGMLPILEILETCPAQWREVILNLLRIVNLIILNDWETQENLCFVGGIPIINKYAANVFPREIRSQAAAFVRQMYESTTLILQMFVSAGGLNVLVDFLEDDYDDERELVLIGVNGIWSVFELQGSTPKNDFCRILSRNSVLDPLSLVLCRVLDEQDELSEICEGRIANIFFIFSQAENYVKEIVAERTVLHRVLKQLRRMSPAHQVTMLKFIKNLSMLSTTLDSLQNANAIDVLTELLRTSMKEPHSRDVSNQILNTIFNLCRLSKPRQEDAAVNGIIPILQKIVKAELPLKEFALPILCDMAHSGKVGRRELWRHKGLAFYISLLHDPNWQVSALDAIFTWLQEEYKVEEHLIKEGTFADAIVRCLTLSKAKAFENLLDPLQKLLRLSPPVALSLARPDLFSKIVQKLSHTNPTIRLNLLRIVQSICGSSEDPGGVLTRYNMIDVIRGLEKNDTAVLVRTMAGEIMKMCEEIDGYGGSGRRRPGTRRTSSTTTPPSLLTSQSQIIRPTTPRSSQHRQSTTPGFFEPQATPRHRRNGTEGSAISMSRRPISRGDSSPAILANGQATPSSSSGVRSRLPRQSVTDRLDRRHQHSNSAGSSASTAVPASRREDRDIPPLPLPPPPLRPPSSSSYARERRRPRTANADWC